MADLASGRASDRLICGDVGFGKTEVALRAAFIAAMAGYQVALVAPTTLLARQHGKVFIDRFNGFPVKIGVLSRMTQQSRPNSCAPTLPAARSNRDRNACPFSKINKFQ